MAPNCLTAGMTS